MRKRNKGEEDVEDKVKEEKVGCEGKRKKQRT